MTDTWQSTTHQGWWVGEKTLPIPGADENFQYIHELYSRADPTYTGRVTVPTLWDSKRQTIVSNESSEIIRMFNSAFPAFAEPTEDLYPDHLRDEIDAVNALVLKGVNNAVNECGRSTSQSAYDEAFDLLFATLDELEDRLSRQRYLCGDRMTEADWRLYPNMCRFDAVYYIGYKCNLRRIEDYPNLSNYLRDLYQTPGVAAVTDIDAIKRTTFAKEGPIKANGIVPKGPALDLGRPHDRDRFARAA